MMTSGANELEQVDQSFLLDLLGYNCVQAFLHVEPVMKKICRRHQLRPVEFTVLSIVGANPGINQKRLGETINVSAPNLATLLDRMEQSGLLTRQRSRQDKRSHELVLTTAGAERYEKARKQVEQHKSHPALTEQEHRQLIKLLQKVFLPQ